MWNRFSRVSDPHWFNADPDTDPDLAFFLIADPDSGSGSRFRTPDPDPGSGLRIRIQDLDPGFDDLKLKKIYSWKFYFYFLDKKLLFIYPYASIKDAQATGEAFSPEKRTSST
jgi:hypothetical protein